ncbi:hypothetical protein KIPB_007353, partial [Kipferlia bialata]|eukprot:g7353.t1
MQSNQYSQPSRTSRARHMWTAKEDNILTEMVNNYTVIQQVRPNWKE